MMADQNYSEIGVAELKRRLDGGEAISKRGHVTGKAWRTANYLLYNKCAVRDSIADRNDAMKVGRRATRCGALEAGTLILEIGFGLKAELAQSGDP